MSASSWRRSVGVIVLMRCSTSCPSSACGRSASSSTGIRLGHPAVARADGHRGQQREGQRRDPSVGDAGPVPALFLHAPPARVVDRPLRGFEPRRSSRRTSRRSRSLAMPAICGLQPFEQCGDLDELRVNLPGGVLLLPKHIQRVGHLVTSIGSRRDRGQCHQTRRRRTTRPTPTRCVSGPRSRAPRRSVSRLGNRLIDSLQPVAIAGGAGGDLETVVVAAAAHDMCAQTGRSGAPPRGQSPGARSCDGRLARRVRASPGSCS